MCTMCAQILNFAFCRAALHPTIKEIMTIKIWLEVWSWKEFGRDALHLRIGGIPVTDITKYAKAMLQSLPSPPTHLASAPCC